jgi:hypothetical protein
MKKRYFFVAILVMAALASGAQVPQKFNYQAVVRDAQQGLITGRDVGFRMSILEGSASGEPVYVETHTVTTNAYGIADLVIGEGSVSSGVFGDILWGEDSYFLKVEADPAGGSAYEHIGTSQLISVPYALYSGNVSSPTRKFTVQEEEGHPVDSALFEVRNTEGQTVFAVYPEGTRIYILDEEAKGKKGGFAVGGYSRSSKGITQEYMRVTPDSIRLYVDEEATKGKKGGFAVGGYSRSSKRPTDNYFMLKPDSAKFTLVSDGDMNGTNALSVITKPKGGGPGDPTGNSLLNLTMENYLIGHRAGESITDGVENCFIGFESGVNNTSGTTNIFIGQQSGSENLEGSSNMFIGPHAGTNNRIGHSNIFLGTFTGNQQVDGDNNIYIGSHAAEHKPLGFENVFIGYSAGKNNQEGSSNIFIGSMAGMFESGNDKLIIDSHGRDSTGALIYGDLYNGKVRNNNQLGVGRNANVHALEVEGTVSKTEAGSWMVNSDARIKTDIEDITGARQQIMKLHPVRFRYTDEWMELNPSIRDIDHYNFVAQEFQQVFPDAVQKGGDRLPGGDPLLQLDSYPAQVVAIKAVQELIEENQSQQVLIDQLLNRVETLEATLLESR